ncbi:hypothetical protein [Dokdonella fugitiva]|jgi:hypothetical protein|nr:hypothetical protein [Dokdonella fugitiva]MBA8883759.1 hypothetical protein [Dokdonella fugitiva]
MSAATMHKGEFVAGMAVRPVGSMHVMTLGGTPDEWICSWYDNDEHRAMRYMPEDLEPVCMLEGDAGIDDSDEWHAAIAAPADWADDASSDVAPISLDED